jgi:hypothetical protein
MASRLVWRTFAADAKLQRRVHSGSFCPYPSISPLSCNSESRRKVRPRFVTWAAIWHLHERPLSVMAVVQASILAFRLARGASA